MKEEKFLNGARQRISVKQILKNLKLIFQPFAPIDEFIILAQK